MNSVSYIRHARALPLVVALIFAALMPMSHQVQAAGADSPSSGLMSYRRLLPLEGGSNFRDMGGYPTVDGRTVKRGLLFRSGVIKSLRGFPISSSVSPHAGHCNSSTPLP